MRLLLNLLTLLSLLLCIAALGLWAHAFSAGPNVVNLPITWSTTPGDHWAIVTARHQVALHHVHEDPTAYSPAGATPEAVPAWAQQFGQGSRWELLGFLKERSLNFGQTKDGRTYYAGWETWTAAPYWALVLATAPLPVLRAVRYRRRRQMRRAAESNRCPTCGYDLRASPDRCPECGTAIGDRRLAGGLARRSAAQDVTFPSPPQPPHGPVAAALRSGGNAVRRRTMRMARGGLDSGRPPVLFDVGRRPSLRHLCGAVAESRARKTARQQPPLP